MKCNELELRAMEYMDGKLPLREREAVDLHVASCHACAERLRGLAEVSRLLDTWEGIQPSAWFDARLEQRILAGAGPRGWWPRLLWLQRPALAGAMAAVLLVAVALVRYSSSMPMPATETASVPAVVSVADSSDEIALYQDLPVLENWDMLSNFDVLQDLKGAAYRTTP